LRSSWSEQKRGWIELGGRSLRPSPDEIQVFSC
jgi:hypothetical protein